VDGYIKCWGRTSYSVADTITYKWIYLPISYNNSFVVNMNFTSYGGRYLPNVMIDVGSISNYLDRFEVYYTGATVNGSILWNCSGY
jgi:hypothetical protein